ncbi:hypothetical protein QFZ66_000132 [Streptomyces sp. B4I13]|nr:hypothetical protein [Streptomyces sp. B4I13]MDQ0956254.1 hypothetical protein [Streptomyces sp. B4I13]
MQRAEVLHSARNGREYDEISEMFTDLYPDVSVPKNAGRWIGAVQHRMAQAGEHRASAVDLVIAAPRPITVWLSSMMTPTTGPLPGTHPT